MPFRPGYLYVRPHKVLSALRLLTSCTALGALLLASGTVALTYEAIVAVTQSRTTGVVRSCTLGSEPGFSAPSLPPEAPQRFLRCTVDIEVGGAQIGPAEVLYKPSDPITNHIHPGRSVDIIGSTIGPWRHFRPIGYPRNLGTMQLGVVLIGLGMAMKLLCRAA